MKSAARLLGSSLAFVVALALALAAAHWYRVPQLAGTPERSAWVEPDLLCSLASSAVALSVAAWSRRSAVGVGAIASRSVFWRALIWVLFTLLFLALWATQLGLLTLLVAPTHALACARLVTLWSKWRSDVLFERAG